MADWTNEDHYQFADARKDPTRWVWEFLRRNEDYKADFASARRREKRQIARYTKLAGTKRVRRPFGVRRGLGRDWKLKGRIRDPADDRIPPFRFVWPEIPSLMDVLKFYEAPESGGDADQRKSYAVVVYRLSENLGVQLAVSEVLLQKLRAERGVQPAIRSIGHKVFARYLRVFDARAAGASNKQIIEYIPFYARVAEKSEDPQAVHKRINKDRGKALELIKDPWGIIRR